MPNDQQAQQIAREVATAVAQWRSEAARFGIGKAACDRMESAFAHSDLDAALALA